MVVDSVGKTSVVTSGSFQKGDTLLAMNGNSIKYQYEFLEVKSKYADSLVIVQLKRGADTLAVKTLINGSGQIGLFVKLPYALFTTVHKEFGFIDAFPEGVRRCFTTLDNYVQGIKQIFTGKVNPNDSLGSLISIGNTFPSSWDWERFWTLTAIFSIILAFMNVLPIPALDGGHALFILFEMITGRKPSDKFMEYAQIAMFLIVTAKRERWRSPAKAASVATVLPPPQPGYWPRARPVQTATRHRPKETHPASAARARRCSARSTRLCRVRTAVAP